MLGFFEAAFSDQVPWRLGSEQEDGEKECGPHPLKSLSDGQHSISSRLELVTYEWDPVTPLRGKMDQSIEYTSSDQLADDKTHVGVTGQVDTKRQRQNLRRVCRSDGGEYTPGKPLSCKH